MAYQTYVVFFVPSGADATYRDSRHVWVAGRESKDEADAYAVNTDRVAEAVAEYGAGTLSVTANKVEVPVWAEPRIAYYNTTDRALVQSLTPLRSAVRALHNELQRRYNEVQHIAKFHNVEVVNAAHNAIAQAHRGVHIVVLRADRGRRLASLTVQRRVQFCQQMSLGPLEFTNPDALLENMQQYARVLGSLDPPVEFRIPADPLVWVNPLTDPPERISYKYAINFSGPLGYNKNVLAPQIPDNTRSDFVAGLDLRHNELAMGAEFPIGQWIDEMTE